MKTAYKITRQNVAQTLFVCMAFSQFAQSVQAASTDLANVPMAVANSVTPNVLVILDNSQSMDAYMSGSLIAGSDPSTRGNVGRAAMRNLAITPYRTAFNWGLMTYGMGAPGLYKTWVYLMGSGTGMVFTNDCVGYVAGVPASYPPNSAGISASNGNRRCIPNPQPITVAGVPYNYVTYDVSSDDANILDALYDNGGYTTAWALSTGAGTGYKFYSNHVTNVITWNTGDFSGDPFGCGNCTLNFTPTDAGFLPSNPPVTRQLYLPRSWGYMANITGTGTLNEAVIPDSTTHYNILMDLLANETNGAPPSGHGPEIKNAALFTSTTGTLSTAKTYFAGGSTPIKYACQQNFVMLVTDGLPTAKTNGTMYPLVPDQVNTCNWSTTTNSCTSGTLSTAVNDVITQLNDPINGLRFTTVPGVTSTNPDGSGTVTGNFDIQTYVVGLGNTVVNASNFSALNAMAYNGGGISQALLATDPATFQSAINAITNDITAKVGSSAAVSVANAHVTSTDNASYASSYNSGTWAGDVNAYPINLTTGLPGTTSLWTAGSAQTQLDTMTSAGRYIATSTAVAGAIGGVPFQWASLSTTATTGQQALLNTPGVTPVDGAAVLAYLRGDRSGETAGTYRVRAHLFGDTVDAEPLLIRAPSAGYADAGYQDSTTAFKQVNAGRTRMLYQGANEGMLHAFTATTGTEAWAYVPNLVMNTLNALSTKTGFTHQYRVDGTPVSGDVDFKNCCTTGAGTDWRTILVGGLGKGGRGYYALDVTNPVASSEAAVASMALWEFPNSVSNTAQRNAALLNTGYTFGKPIIVKTKATGWVVLVTSGYNNGTNAGDSGGDGLGHLFVLNPKTGDLLKDIPTTGCTATPASTPCGLAQISAYVENADVDNTTDFVYGGDLMGNVWRFDLSGSNVASWGVARFAVLKDAGGVTQPITTIPELAKNTINGVAYRYVYVGTGQYLGNSDVPCPTGGCVPARTPNSHAAQTQTMYGLVDTLTAALPDPLRSSLVQQTLTTVGTTRTATAYPVDPTVKNGWYIDLLDTGERINTDPVLASGVLTFTTNTPSSTVCVPGGSSWLYFLDYKTGGAYNNPATGSTTVPAGTSLGNALASRPVLIQLPSGQEVVLVRKSDATTVAQNAPPPATTSTGKRVSWRELVQ